MLITFGPSDDIRVDHEALSSWFPAISLLGYSQHHISGKTMAKQLHNRIDSRYQISKSAVEQALCLLFKQFHRHPFAHHGQTRTRVIIALQDQLREDFQEGLQWTGLVRSRHNFLVLAHLAKDQGSHLLAGALLEFCMRNQMQLKNERDRYIKHWKTALSMLQSLGPAGMLAMPSFPGFDTVAMLPQGGWLPGQPHHQAALAWPGDRAISAPVTRHRANYNTGHYPEKEYF
ncbi:hypothetical protein ACN47E_008395 [Coniothyrium glycines]